MTTAAIYGRVSSDNQNERSPDDQVADCRAFAAEQGWETPDDLVFIDRAISGATAARPAYQRMRAALAAGAFDVLLAFDGSRIARNERDFFELLDDLQAAGARAISVSTRQSLDELSERFQSVISAYDRQRIAVGTRRGLKARARGAKATGGLAYGYTTEPCVEGGRRIIVKPAEAAVVRRIFEEYANGQGLKALAHALNAEQIPAPTPRGVRGKEGAAPSWAPTSVREMLRNDLYRGQLVYNRSRWVRQRNGKRKRFDRPREEWIAQDVPELRIIAEDAWNAAHDMIAKRAADSPQKAGAERATKLRHRLLAGVLRCGECGFAFCSHSAHSGQMGCSGRRARGTCDIALRVSHDEVAERILAAIDTQLLNTEAVEKLIAKATELVEAALKHGEHERDREQLAVLDRKIRRKTEVFEDEDDEVAAAGLRRELVELRNERRRLRERVAAAESGSRLDAAAIRARLSQMAQDVRERFAKNAAEGREAIIGLIAEDERGHQRLDVIEDAAWPGGYRIAGKWRIRIEINTAPIAREERRSSDARPATPQAIGSGGGI